MQQSYSPKFVKGFVRNNGNNTYTGYQLGAYPEGIEMASSFDLEEEFKIGGNKEVFISDAWPSPSNSSQQEPFEITEIYYDNTEYHNITHTVKVSISSATENYLVDDNQNVIYTASELQDKGITVSSAEAINFVFDNGHNIEINLYKGAFSDNNLMHTKIVYVRIMEDQGVQLIKEVIA